VQDNTGYIKTPEEVKAEKERWQKILGDHPEWKEFERPGGHLTPMEVAPTVQQLLRNPPRVGRNELCPCGSGKKYKYCHGEHNAV
jgi:preprotein translocase subunit SecA